MNDAVVYLGFKLIKSTFVSPGDIARALGLEGVEFMAKMNRMERDHLLAKHFTRGSSHATRDERLLFIGYGLTLRGFDEMRKLGLLL